jgi:hypothetical protein
MIAGFAIAKLTFLPRIYNIFVSLSGTGVAVPDSSGCGCSVDG